jgi:hypothetical protein
MKLNFRKIASVLSSVVMVSSTVALAAAATYPAPFVQDGRGQVVIVQGSGTGADLDAAAITELTNDLKLGITETTGSTTTTTVTGESFTIEKASDKFNLGDTTTSFFTKLDVGELPSVLADGTYTNDNDDYEYTQELALGGLTLAYLQDNNYNDEKPFIGIDASEKAIMNYTLDFDTAVDADNADTTAADFDALEDTDIIMLGKKYYIAKAEVTGGDIALTLMDSANTQRLYEGESVTVELGGQSYDVSLDLVEDNSDDDLANFIVSGKDMGDLRVGGVKKVEENVYIGVSKVKYVDSDTRKSYADFSLGSGKIYLRQGEKLQINDEDVDDIEEYNDAVVNVFITNSSSDIDSIKLEWIAGDDTYLMEGDELVMPGFESVKLSMGAFDVSDYEKTMIKADGTTAIQIQTAIEDDDSVSFPIAYLNATGNAYGGVGKSSTRKTVTSATNTLTFDMDNDDYFVASWFDGDEAESYLLEVTKIDDTTATKNTTTVRSSGGTSVEIDLNEIEDFGNVQLKLTAASEDDKTATFEIQANGGTASFNKLYTKNGLRMTLPVFSVTQSGEGVVNNSVDNGGDPSSLTLTFQEEDREDNINDGSSFTVTLGSTSSKTSVTATNVTDYETDDDTDLFQGYVIGEMGTMTELDIGDDQDSITINYPDAESVGNVMIAESGAIVTSTNGTVSTGVPQVMDTEASTITNKNLIVVGGSCVNSFAATLIGATYPACGAAWETKTGVGVGKFLIQTFERDNSKVATLVAGWADSDTKNAVTTLRTDKTLNIAAGNKYTGTLGSVTKVTVN